MFHSPLFYLCRITGFCLPFAFFSNAKTIFESLSKKPEPFFQLIPHLQCCKPMNCCRIFLPQFGHILLLFPIGRPILPIKHSFTEIIMPAVYRTELPICSTPRLKQHTVHPAHTAVLQTADMPPVKMWKKL